MKKSTIKSFLKRENGIKVALLSEIKEKFESYKKDEVVLHSILDVQYIDGFDELEELMYNVNPLIADSHCQMDATAYPHSISYEGDELVLKVDGEASFPDKDFITLEMPTFGLSVDGLYNLLCILKHKSVRKINK